MSLFTDISSPFELSADAVAVLEHDDAFQTVRQRMERKDPSTDQMSFCPFHCDECSEQQRAVFQLHRDVIYSLLVPLFEIHNQATQIAVRVLGRRQGAEPERAFRGEARGAFTWLHCILTEERDFCLAEGCPACIVLHVLSSEPIIRLVTVACLLSDCLSGADFAEVKQNDRPEFGFWLKAMENAVCEDSLWGDGFWPEIEHRAKNLAVDIRYLIMQCADLRNGTELQKTSITSKSSCSVTMRSERHAYRVHVRSIPVQPSALARRQLNMMWEEQELVSKFLQSCWNSLCWNDRRQRMLEFSRLGSIHHLPQESTIS